MVFFISKPDQEGSYINISDEQEQFFDWLKHSGYLTDGVVLDEIKPICLF